MPNSKIHTKLSLKQLLFLAIVLLLEITITATLYNTLKQREKTAQAIDFNATSKKLTAAIEQEISLNLEVLTSINALYSVIGSVSREQFKIFNKDVLNKTNSIQALEWIPIVKREEKDFYESMARKDGLSEFLITEKVNDEMIPVANRSEYYPVFYVEPLLGNEKALGFDLASNPARLATLQKAIKINDLTATSIITLVQEENQQKGMLVFSPVKKEEEFIGFSLGVYKIKELITRSTGNLANIYCHLTVYDISAENENQLLTELNINNTTFLPNDAVLIIPDGMNYQQKIKVADREWLIISTPTQAYLNSLSDSTGLILIIFIILSIGILYNFYQNFNTINQRKFHEITLKSKVIERTKELQESNKELEQAIKSVSDYKTAIDNSSIVSISDIKGNITHVNKLFCKISGYSKDELIGKNHRIINSDYHTEDFWKEMWRTIAKGKMWHNEIRNQTKKGNFYWVDTTIVPFMNKNNKPYQYVSIRKDITQQKLIEQKTINSIIYSQEKDREYFAEDLHEGLAQTLAGLSYQVESIESKIMDTEDDELKSSISSIKNYIHQSLEDTKQLAMDLMPRSMMKDGLIPSIEHYIYKRCSHLSIEFYANIEKDLIKKDVEINIYRTLVAIIEKVKSSSTVKKIIIKLNDDSGLQIKTEIFGEINLETNEGKENTGMSLISFQKRIELQGGRMIIIQDTKNKRTTINIKFEFQKKQIAINGS